MKTVKRTMYYPTFNEKQNTFSYEEFDHERPMSPKERKWHIATTILEAILITVFLVGLTLFIIGACNDWVFLGIPALIAMAVDMVLFTIYHFTIERHYDCIMLNAQDIGFDDEILRWEQITQEQNIIAQEWRAEHPLEEAIRKAQLSKNCVDIAALARLYAQEIRGE